MYRSAGCSTHDIHVYRYGSAISFSTHMGSPILRRGGLYRTLLVTDGLPPFAIRFFLPVRFGLILRALIVAVLAVKVATCRG